MFIARTRRSEGSANPTTWGRFRQRLLTALFDLSNSKNKPCQMKPGELDTFLNSGNFYPKNYMALTKCPECNKDVSSQATACPHCGHPLAAAQGIPGVSPATPPPIQPQGKISSTDPGGPSGQKKMSKAKMGCLVFLVIIFAFLLLAVIGAFMAGSSQDKTSQDTNNVVQDLKNSPLAQRILSLNSDNAYESGKSDGLQDAKGFLNNPPTNATIYDFIDLKTNLITLAGAAEPKIDAAVLNDYQRGWVDGANSAISSTSVSGSGPSPLSKAGWKAKLSQNNGLFRVTGTKLTMNKADFVKLMGNPDRTQTAGDTAYWYYDCSDGTIEIDLNAGDLNMGGIMQGNVSDY